MTVPRLKVPRCTMPRLVVPTTSTTVYADPRWRRTSRALRRQRPVCERCRNDLATEVHHKVPIDQAPELAFVLDNLMSVCTACHKSIHRKPCAAP